MASTVKKPKRPLSAFNLFYRYKRSLLSGVGDISNDILKNIITCPVGLENEKDGLSVQPKIEPNSILTSSAEINEKRRIKIRTALGGNILPADTTKRRHRKAADGPKMDFVKMGRMMTDAWKAVDAYGKQVFDELAAEGRDIYRVVLKEYNQKIDPPRESDAATAGGGEDGGGGDVIEKYDAPMGAPLKSKGSRRSSSSSSSSSSKKKSSRKQGKKNTAHKVSRSVAKKRPSSDSMDASPIPWSSPNKSIEDEAVCHLGSREPLSVEEFMSLMLNDDEGDEGPLLRPKPKGAHTGGIAARSLPTAQRRHSLPNPEEIMRSLARSAPAPEDFYKPMLQQQKQFPPGSTMFPQYPPPFDIGQFPSGGFPMGNQQQHEGGVNGMVTSPSRSRNNYHRSTSLDALPSSSSGQPMNFGFGAPNFNNTSNPSSPSSLMSSHNGNNQEHVPPLTPVSQSSGSGRSASDLPIAFDRSSCIDRNSFPFAREYYLQQQYQRQQQQEQHFSRMGGHFKTTGLPQQDPHDNNFHQQQQQRDHFNNNFSAYTSVAFSSTSAATTFPYHEEKKNDFPSQNSHTMRVGQDAMSNQPMSMLDNEFLNNHFDNPEFDDDIGEIDLDNEDVMNVFD